MHCTDGDSVSLRQGQLGQPSYLLTTTSDIPCVLCINWNWEYYSHRLCHKFFWRWSSKNGSNYNFPVNYTAKCTQLMSPEWSLMYLWIKTKTLSIFPGFSLCTETKAETNVVKLFASTLLSCCLFCSCQTDVWSVSEVKGLKHQRHFSSLTWSMSRQPDLLSFCSTQSRQPTSTLVPISTSTLCCPVARLCILACQAGWSARLNNCTWKECCGETQKNWRQVLHFWFLNWYF